MLDPLIVMGHQALNPERDIPSSEWFGLLVLQQEHSRDALLTWQKRAAGAGRSEIRLGYYGACAADAAFGTMRGREPRPDRREPAQDPPPAMPKTAPAPRRRAPEPWRASEPPAAPMRGSRVRELLLDGIERLIGGEIRYRENLAGVPLALLAQWREIAAHPGLRKLDDPIAYLVKLAADGKNPPALDELNAWAQQAGVHWADPSLSTSLCDGDQWDEGGALADAGSDCVPNCIDSATEMISSGLDPRGSLWDNLLRSEAVPTDLTFALREALAEMLPQRCWPLLERFSVRIADGVTYIVAARSLHDIVWDMQGVIRDALLDLGLPDMGKIIAPADAQPTEPVAELPRPDWIGAEVWRELPAVARAALVRSKLGADGIVGGNLRALERCFPDLLPRLMASAQPGASP